MLILHEDSVISLECFFPLSKKKKNQDEKNNIDDKRLHSGKAQIRKTERKKTHEGDFAAGSVIKTPHIQCKV